MSFRRVEGHSGIQKDVATGAVVSTDRDGLLAARKRRQAILEERDKVKSLEEKVEALERMLKELIGRDV